MKRVKSIVVAAIAAVVLGGCEREAPNVAANETDKKTSSPESKKASPTEGLDGLPGPPSRKRPGMAYRPTNPRKNSAAADPNSPTSSAYRASKYSDNKIPSPGQPPATRSLPAPTPTETEKAQELTTRANATSSREDAMRALDEAAGLTSGALFPFVLGLAKHPDPDVQGRALSLLQGVNSEDALPAVAEGLASSSEDVRLVALDVLESVKSEDAAPLLTTGMSDPDKDVRQAALARAFMQEGPTRDQLVANATKSSFVDVALTALNVVRSESRKSTTSLLIDALGHSSPLVRDLAHETLFLTFQNDLKTPAEAAQWWNTHQQYFDDNLALKDPADLSKILPQN
jgi:hypothetical protein